MVSSLVACTSASPFKSINATKTDLGLSELDAIQFILNYITDSDLGVFEHARSFISDSISSGLAFPLHLLLTAAHGYTGVLRYFLHPTLSIEVNARVKTQLLKFVKICPQHDPADWKILWNQRVLELVRYIREFSLHYIPDIRY